MTPNDLRKLEYAKRLEVNALRQRAYGRPDPAAEESLMDALQLAESELSDLHRRLIAARIQTRTQSDLHEVRGAGSTGLDTEITLHMGFVPTSIYQFLDDTEQPLVSVRVRNTQLGSITRRIRVTSFIEGYSAQAIETFELDELQDKTVRQSPTLFAERIRSVTELTSATLNVVVEDLDGTVEAHRTERIRLLARSTAPLAVRDAATDGWIDLTRYLGAYVTPNAPEVLSFLRTAADHHPDRELVGYQSTYENTEAQVRAVFDALKQSGIVYVNSVVSFSPEDGATAQRVRLPRESLADRQANCVDGTVLIASLLESASLSPAIVVIPGHAFVAWETSHDGNEWHYLETTMIGESSFEQACASAERTADRYRAQREMIADPFQFRIWPLHTLRTEHRITPME